MILHGDCLETLKHVRDSSIDSVVTDPPYGLSFMGKKWDYSVPSVDVWREVFRVLKPGGHLLSFGGTRTYHRMVVAIEDAGFEIRDQIAWVYGQGFPKSQNVQKVALKLDSCCGCTPESKSQMPSLRNASISASVSASTTSDDSLQSSVQKQSLRTLDSQALCIESSQNGEESGLERRRNLQAEQRQLHRPEVCAVSARVSADGSQRRLRHGAPASDGDAFEPLPDANGSGSPSRPRYAEQSDRESRSIPKQPDAQTCGGCGKRIIDAGLGTALKPALEPICVARKPLSESTVAKNVLKHGTGALNIDGSRIGEGGHHSGFTGAGKSSSIDLGKNYVPGPNKIYYQGRWPANVIFDEDAASVLDEQSGVSKSTDRVRVNKNPTGNGNTHGHMAPVNSFGFSDFGGASRFFYVAKASKRERNAGLDSYERIAIDGGCKEENTVAVQLLQRVTSESMVKWSIAECGKRITASFPKECRFTIETGSKQITDSKILNSLMLSLTSGSIQDASNAADTGLSRAESVAKLRAWLLNITNGSMELARGASLVVSETLQKISESDAKPFVNFHSTVKPVKLMEYLVALVTPPNGTVLDPFMGSGTTGVAAKRLSFDFIGCELNEEYIAIAEKRIEAALG